jgi:hypothetical protein
MKTTTMPRTHSPEDLVEEKHNEYIRKAKWYSYLYYTTRIAAGLSAALLPFTVRSSVDWSTTFSIIIVVTTVLDLTLSPKDRWITHSKATDLLTIARLKADGNYEKYKEALDIIAQTESANLQRLADLDSLVDKPQPRQKP